MKLAFDRRHALYLDPTNTPHPLCPYRFDRLWHDKPDAALPSMASQPVRFTIFHVERFTDPYRSSPSTSPSSPSMPNVASIRSSFMTASRPPSTSSKPTTTPPPSPPTGSPTLSPTVASSLPSRASAGPHGHDHGRSYPCRVAQTPRSRPVPHPMDRLDPTLDLVFKLLLTREPALLIDMLEGILAKPIGKIRILNPEIPGELTSDKTIVLDIRVELVDGSRVDVEMQIRPHPHLASRIVYYAARDYADQLQRGDEYHLLTPTIVVVWVVEPLFADLDRFHSIFELRERHTHMRFSDQLTIHLLQLRSTLPPNPTGYHARIDRWARFLVARTNADLAQLASEDPIMATAKQTLDQLSQDPAARRLARDRADAIFYKMDLIASEARGRLVGKTEGEARLLLKQLGLRFSDPSEAVRTRVETATPEQLDLWAERVLTAKTLDEVFAP